MGTKEDLSKVSNQVEDLKRILENTNEIIKLLEKNPDLAFHYPGLLRLKSVTARTIAEKIAEVVLPQLTKMTATKIAERAKLEKQTK